MKIVVVTFYHEANYGAMLQAYALKSRLESLGHEVVFLNHPRFSFRRIPFWSCFVARSLAGIRFKLGYYVQHSITEFTSSFQQTARCRTVDEARRAVDGCDAVLVGSDQVWNPLGAFRTADDLRIAMLDFAPKGMPRISYAVSFGNKEWPMPENARQVGECLMRFGKISVREQCGVALVKTLSGRDDAVCVLDPTLLHTAEFWHGVIENGACGHTGGGYIFRYVLGWGDTKPLERALDAVKGNLGITQVKDVEVPVEGVLSPLFKSFGVMSKITVPQWLAYIHDAAFVFTNSFHGTVFSILFHRPFVSLLIQGEGNGMNERILSLLDILGLSDRAIRANEIDRWIPNALKSIDWDDVDTRLSAWRRKSEAFLSSLG